MPDTQHPKYLFIVLVDDDGKVTIDNTVPDGVEVSRQANSQDILDTSRRIVADLEHTRIVDAVASLFTAAQTAAVPPTAAQRVHEALRQRTAEKAAEAVADADPTLADDPEA
jgi:hypothetical protein